MHFEILVEDASGKAMLDALVPKIIGVDHTFSVHAYKGIGRIPVGLKPKSDAQKRILLDQLPRLIRGYGHSFMAYPSDYIAILIVVCDLDDRCLKTFRRELLDVLKSCHPAPETHYCIAIEEGEAWYLGDQAALKTAYPHAKDRILDTYTQDAICGTWEILADAIVPGGSHALSNQGWQAIGREKAIWAKGIAPQMDVEHNLSPSFGYFRDKLRQLCQSKA